jgi:hypothetical protein
LNKIYISPPLQKRSADVQAAKKVNRKRKAGGENAELADLGTAEEGFRPPAAEKELSSKRETRPENPGSSPVEIPQSGDENRGEQGGAGSKRNFHTSGLLDQMTARLSGSKFRCVIYYFGASA